MHPNDNSKSEGLIYEKMKKFISIIDELRDFGLQSYVSLPRIAVLGLQSAGKSSLLESIVGFDFLPRGEGVVTRRPLELRLVHAVDVKEPYGIFEKYSADKIKDFNKIRDKIIEYTNKDAGLRKGIINTPITLTVYSENCPDLSLVDLPGITKIPVKDSDHPMNIEELTTNLALSYVRDPRTIILCTVQANIDLSTSDAIKIAKQIDLNGERTICALTKVDLVDRGSEILNILNNDEVVLKYGYVAVKNRSAQDIKENVTVQQGLEIEERFFSQDKYIDFKNRGLVGTKNLVNRLSLILSKNIQASLPQIIKELREKIEQTERELRELGNPLPDQSSDKLQLIYNLASEFCIAYKDSIKGKYIKNRDDRDKDPVGVEIRRRLIQIFNDYDLSRIDEVLSDKLIKASFVNYGASSLPGFPSFSAFQKLLQPLLQNFVPKSNELCDTINLRLERTIQELVERIFKRFPELQETISNYAMRNLNRCKGDTEEMVNSLLEAELGYLYTSDDEFLNYHGSILPQRPKGKNEQQLNMSEAFVIEIRERVKDYFLLVDRNLKDSIPKTIGEMLLNDSSNKMQIEIFDGINKDAEEISRTLSEPEYILAQRKQCQQALRILKNCLKKLQEENLLEEDY
jgi:GTPase SAR1 family protein